MRCISNKGHVGSKLTEHTQTCTLTQIHTYTHTRTQNEEKKRIRSWGIRRRRRHQRLHRNLYVYENIMYKMHIVCHQPPASPFPPQSNEIYFVGSHSASATASAPHRHTTQRRYYLCICAVCTRPFQRERDADIAIPLLKWRTRRKLAAVTSPRQCMCERFGGGWGRPEVSVCTRSDLCHLYREGRHAGKCTLPIGIRSARPSF